VYSFEARSKLRALLREINPEACLVHNVYHHISPSILSVLREHEIPTVLTLHDLKLACPAYKMLNTGGICERCRGGKYVNLLKHRCIKESLALSAVIYVEATLHRFLDSYASNVDRFIVPSKFLIDKMAEWGVSRDKMVHIRNFVNLQPFSPSPEVGTRFLYFGRLAPEKGLKTLIRAASAADVPLRIVGTGPEETALKELANDMGSQVEFSGYLTGDALVQAVRGARAVVVPSEWYENAPVSILEAYAEGVPVIGAEIGGIPELIADGETGRIFPSGSIELLSEQLRSISDLDDSGVKIMGRAGRKMLEQEFNGDVHTQRLTNLLEELGVASSTLDMATG
jgi:glycosyltransferase involved in cell wall biosynthesis